MRKLSDEWRSSLAHKFSDGLAIFDEIAGPTGSVLEDGRSGVDSEVVVNCGGDVLGRDWAVNDVLSAVAAAADDLAHSH